MKQKYTSEKTSLNHIPAPARKLIAYDRLNAYSRNLDIGGGKYDRMTRWFNEFDITNYVYDPFNRSIKHNDNVLSLMGNGKSDTVTIFNVLNVIMEEGVQIEVLKLAKSSIKYNGEVYIYSNYYVKGKKPGPVNGRGSYQHNYKLKDLLPIVKKVFPNVVLDTRIKCIIAKK